MRSHGFPLTLVQPSVLWQLRATAGPLEGASYPLRQCTMLGRAADCDIQIIGDGVSRKHAKILQTRVGHFLIDLSSNNGTYVDGNRVRTHTLTAGDEISIMHSRFIYEGAPEDDDTIDGTSGTVVKITSGETLRQTVDHEIIDPTEDSVPASSQADTLEDLCVPTGKPERRRHKLVATHPNGTPYPGDLLLDIAEHSALEQRWSRRDSTLSVDECQRLSRLRDVFRPPGVRTGLRWDTSFPARIRWLAGHATHTHVVKVRSLGADGAGLVWPGHLLRADVATWMVVSLVSATHVRTLVFPARVERTTENEIDILFTDSVAREDFNA